MEAGQAGSNTSANTTKEAENVKDASGSNLIIKSTTNASGGSGSNLVIKSNTTQASATVIEPAPAPLDSTEKVRRISIPAYTLSSAHNDANIPARTRRLSGKYNAEVWKQILGDYDPASVLQFHNEDDEVLYLPEPSNLTTSTSFGFGLGGLFGSHPRETEDSGTSLSALDSITPIAITLSVPDFKTLPPLEEEGKQPKHQLNKGQRMERCLTCGASPKSEQEIYAKLKTKFSNACSSVDKFYSSLETDFIDIDSELEFDMQIPAPLSQDLNVIAAQIWFITLALSKQLGQQIQFDAETRKKLLQSFQSIINDSMHIAECIPRIEKLINEYELEGLIDGVGHLKKSLTGRSDTDLTQEKIGDEIFISPEMTTSKTNRESNAPLKIWDNKVVQYRPRRPSAADASIYNVLHEHESHPERFSLVFAQQDNLKERKRLEIYVRNITKVGWISFENKVPSEKKFVIENEFLSQTKNSLKSIRKTVPRVLHKLEYGSSIHHLKSRRIMNTLAPCLFPGTCLPWIAKMKKCIEELVKSDQFTSTDYELLRMQILTTELQIEKIISRGTAIVQKASNLISVVLLCCDFLSSIHQFHVSNYDKLRPHLIIVPKATKTVAKPKPRISKPPMQVQASSRRGSDGDGNTGEAVSNRKLSRLPRRKSQDEKLDDADFYLHEYAILLKVIPISFGLMEYILVNKIDKLERHSGANFDGPRYLNVIQ